jgi:hypothetical protein
MEGRFAGLKIIFLGVNTNLISWLTNWLPCIPKTSKRDNNKTYTVKSVYLIYNPGNNGGLFNRHNPNINKTDDAV